MEEKASRNGRCIKGMKYGGMELKKVTNFFIFFLFFVAGFASASVCWFLGISTLISLFSAKFTDKTLRIINVVCGLVIIFYGFKLLWTFIQMVM